MAPLLRIALCAAVLAACSCSRSRSTALPAGAKLLYETSFSAPEQTVDTEVKTVEPIVEYPFPTPFPTRVFFGKPMVVATLCGMEQPARLSVASGTNGMEGLEFVFDPRYRTYHVELDVCVVDIAPPQVKQPLQVSLFFDISTAYALGFTNEGEIAILDPNRELNVRDIPVKIGTYRVGVPVRIAVDLDLPVVNQSWRISVDGKVLREGPITANIPRGMRVLVRGNKKTVAAIDNLRIWAEQLMPGADSETPAPRKPEGGTE